MTAASHTANTPRSATLWPREHGAYVELLAPLLSALLFAPSLPGLGWAITACALFVAHEPLLVLLGRRGRRARELSATRARRRLALCAALALPGPMVALWQGGVSTRVALLVTALFCGAAALAVWFDREKTLAGELLSATALLSLALPVLALASVPLSEAARFSGGWLVVHAMATLTARAYVYRKHDRGRLLDWAAGVAALVVMASGALHATGLLSLMLSLVPLPFALVTTLLWTGAFRPRSPKGVGWTLAVANMLAFALLGLTIR